LESIKQNGLSFEFASKELQNDREIVLLAVNQYGYLLEFASTELKNDREIVLSSVNQYGTSVRYASEELRNDLEIVLAAVKQDRYSLNYLDRDLKDKYGYISDKFISTVESELKQLNNTISNQSESNEISFEKLDELNEKNKSLLKECNLTKEDVTLPNLNSKYKNFDTSKDNNVNEKKEVKTSIHKQK
jgi:hypothetical protein